MSDSSLSSLTRDTFSRHLGDNFVVRAEELPELELRLTEANALGGDSDEREPFSLIFLGPLEPILPQAIYSLDHGDLGPIDLFLVPVGPDKERGGIQYEAVFS